MGLGNAPAYVGKINITSDNNELYWDEETSGANNASLNIAEYYHSELATEITTAMNNASVAGSTYSCTFSVELGKFTIERTSGSEDFAIDARSSQAGNIWTGGTTDSAGNTWATEQYGPFFLGWPVATALTAYEAAHTSPVVAGAVWYPSQPAQNDDSGADSGVTIQATAIDGSTVTYSFTEWVTSNEAKHFPLYKGKNQLRRWTYRYISQASRDQYIQWWGPYARTGGTFKYYPDYAGSTFYEYVLAGESLETRTFLERTVQGYPYYSGEIVARGAE